MRSLTAVQSQAFGSTTTSLCWAWRVTRKDGKVMGFTDHDSYFTINNITYEARSGFDAGALEQDIGLSINSAHVQSFFSSEAITEPDLRAGLYDGADVDLFRVDWTNLSSVLHIAHWMFGDVQFSAAGFEVELIGRTAKLDRSTGRVFSRHCDAELGDNRCGVNLSDFTPNTVCPRTLSACREQFNNVRNFRGFPYLLGDDALSRGPLTGEDLDGGSRYS